MFNKMIVAAAFALLPLGASASSIDPTSTIADGGSYNMIGSNFYGETFGTSDVGGTRSFTFNNLNTVDQNIALTVVTVSALAEKFTGGLSFTWLVSGLSVTVGESALSFDGFLNNTIAAGSSDTLVVTFGDPEIRTNSGGRANFTVSLDASPVPLPAGGLLLVGALSGLAALRRRKSV